MDFYKSHLNEYGLPLDSRKDYTKLDWTLWTATLTQNRDDFDALVAPVFRFLNATPNRTPMNDWYQTKTARRVGFDARPVVGGVFLQMLYDKPTWKKWAKQDKTHATKWAKMPLPPVVTTIVPAADKTPAQWNYTTTQPAADWFSPEFNASSWSEGQSGFGTSDTPGSVVHTTWKTDDIWLRREISLTADQLKDVQAWFYHDDDAEVYINGVLAVKAGGWTTEYELFPLTPAAQAALKAGENVVAIHCRQDHGGQFVDFGFVKVEPAAKK
jgi:hypothetical protein